MRTKLIRLLAVLLAFAVLTPSFASNLRICIYSNDRVFEQNSGDVTTTSAIAKFAFFLDGLGLEFDEVIYLKIDGDIHQLLNTPIDDTMLFFNLSSYNGIEEARTEINEIDNLLKGHFDLYVGIHDVRKVGEDQRLGALANPVHPPNSQIPLTLNRSNYRDILFEDGQETIRNIFKVNLRTLLKGRGWISFMPGWREVNPCDPHDVELEKLILYSDKNQTPLTYAFIHSLSPGYFAGKTGSAPELWEVLCQTTRRYNYRFANKYLREEFLDLDYEGEINHKYSHMGRVMLSPLNMNTFTKVELSERLGLQLIQKYLLEVTKCAGGNIDTTYLRERIFLNRESYVEVIPLGGEGEKRGLSEYADKLKTYQDAACCIAFAPVHVIFQGVAPISANTWENGVELYQYFVGEKRLGVPRYRDETVKLATIQISLVDGEKCIPVPRIIQMDVIGSAKRTQRTVIEAREINKMFLALWDW